MHLFRQQCWLDSQVCLSLCIRKFAHSELNKRSLPLGARTPQEVVRIYSELAFPSLCHMSCPSQHPFYKNPKRHTEGSCEGKDFPFSSRVDDFPFHPPLAKDDSRSLLCHHLTSWFWRKKKKKHAGSEPEGPLGILHKDCWIKFQYLVQTADLGDYPGPPGLSGDYRPSTCEITQPSLSGHSFSVHIIRKRKKKEKQLREKEQDSADEMWDESLVRWGNWLSLKWVIQTSKNLMKGANPFSQKKM